MSDLIERLRGLSKYQHSDYSIGDESADRIAELEAENARLKSAAETWHNRNRDNCQRLNDKIAAVGAERESAEQEVARLSAHIRAIASHHFHQDDTEYHTERRDFALKIFTK
jgi:hypothetical protein